MRKRVEKNNEKILLIVKARGYTLGFFFIHSLLLFMFGNFCNTKFFLFVFVLIGHIWVDDEHYRVPRRAVSMLECSKNRTGDVLCVGHRKISK